MARPPRTDPRQRLERRERSELMRCIRRDAEVIAVQFGLRYRALEPERKNVTSRYGVCFSDGTIRIRLQHATTGRPLLYSSLVSTLCHELAHLRHFHHGPSFQAFYDQLLEFARDHEIYQPGERARRAAEEVESAPRQLGLFG
jgi:predicted metal-dependent hydrolase